MNYIFTSHFSYCPIVWIFHSRKLNKRKNRIHEKPLGVVHKEYQLSSQQLLVEDNSLTIQHIEIEIFKVKYGTLG